VVPTAERRRYLRPSAAAITRFIADAYRDAALDRADMRWVVDVLERLGTAAINAGDPFAFWVILDSEAAQAAGTPLQSCITALRVRYLDEVARLAFDRIEKAAKHSHTEGCQEWLRAYANAFSEFRLTLCRRLVEEKPSFDPGSPSSFRQWTNDAAAGRWTRVMPGVRYLLDHAPLDAEERALLLSIAADVDTYWLGDRDAAKRQIDEAITL